MAYEGYIEYDGSELLNSRRTHELSRANGVHITRLPARTLAWLQENLGTGFGFGGFGEGGFGVGEPEDYTDITRAPWYDAGHQASQEFYGFMPLRIDGLDDSTLESTPVEYVTDGGTSGKQRNSTLPLVFSVSLIASTDRGAEYGKRWLDRRLRGDRPKTTGSGATLRYLRYSGLGADEERVPFVHRNDVSLTRGTSVTGKRINRCSVLWQVTFTMVAADPYEYGAQVEQVASMGWGDEDGDPVLATGPAIVDQGRLILEEETCPAYDYSPVYDPLYPALVTPPALPDLLPEGWNIEPGMTFFRQWVLLEPFEPSALSVVPIFTLATEEDARRVRVGIWSGSADPETQCEPYFSAVVTYLPTGMSMYLDGEEEAAYVWTSGSEAVRRSDSLVYSPQAKPVDWTKFNDPDGLMVTLDVFALDDDPEEPEGGGTVRAALSFVPKSD